MACNDWQQSAKPARKRKVKLHGNYGAAAQQERDFLNQRIAEGWLGSRSAGSHGVADVWLINPKAGMHFTSVGLAKDGIAFFANAERKIVESSEGLSIMVGYGMAVQLKSSRAAALKAARDWASGKTQREWRARWETKHKKVMEARKHDTSA